MKNKNILYITYDGMTDQLGQSQVLPYLSELSKSVYSFTILSCEKSDNFKKLKTQINNKCFQSNIIWRPIPYTKKPPVISTLKDLYTLYKVAIKIYREQKFDVVHCRSHIAAIVGLYLKKKLDIAFVFDMRGFYPDEKKEVNTWPVSNPIFKFIYTYFKSKEKEIIAEADGMVVLTETAKRIVDGWNIRPADASPIRVIPCSVDFNHFYQKYDLEEKNALRKKLNIPNEALIVTFLGSLGPWYVVEEILAFFKILLEEKPNSVLFFVTGQSEEYIKSKVTENGIDLNKLFISKAEREEVPLFLSVSDFGLFFIYPYFSKKGSSPTKLGEYLALNIPVVTNSGVGDIDDIINNTKGGVLIKDFSKTAYLEAIGILKKHFLDNKSLDIRSKALPYYDLNRAVKIYQEVYEEAINI